MGEQHTKCFTENKYTTYKEMRTRQEPLFGAVKEQDPEAKVAYKQLPHRVHVNYHAEPSIASDFVNFLT